MSNEDYDHQQAFQNFMLGGGKRASPAAGPKTSSTSPIVSSNSKKKNQSQSSAKKKKISILKAFQGQLQEWNDIDSQLGEVLRSIANLRDRIKWESRSISSREKEKSGTAMISLWSASGLRPENASSLLVEDMQLALTNDLLQHERMLTLARGLVSSLSQVQDNLGRRLEEILLMQMEEQYGRGGQQSGGTDDVCGQCYTFLAQELYRKQSLVQQILESCNDRMTSVNDEEEQIDGIDVNIKEGQNPQTVARKCLKEWSSRNEVEEWSLVDKVLSIENIY